MAVRGLSSRSTFARLLRPPATTASHRPLVLRFDLLLPLLGASDRVSRDIPLPSPSLFMYMLKRSDSGFRLITQTLTHQRLGHPVQLLSYPYAVSGDFGVRVRCRSSSRGLHPHSLLFRRHSITCSTASLRPFLFASRTFFTSIPLLKPNTRSADVVMKAELLGSILLLRL